MSFEEEEEALRRDSSSEAKEALACGKTRK